MMAEDILERIVKRKKEEVENAKRTTPLSTLEELAKESKEKRPFLKNLRSPGTSGVNIIAEIKRASPSKGDIRIDLDPAVYAKTYESGGAKALSVLTDTAFFKGSFDDFKAARNAVDLPVIRKDFIISSYQIFESKVLGADAVLLIVRILSFEQLKRYLYICRELDLDALVEVHTLEDVEAAVAAGAALVGINNRNLKSFKTSIDTSIEMASLLDKKQTAVAESGINSRQDIEKLLDAGIFNFLIGEAIVRAPNPTDFLYELQGMK